MHVTIPPHRMKARRKHVVALSGAALAILRGIKRTADDLVFPALGRDDMRELIPDATAHGMRSCFSTWAGDHGFNRDVVERCLAHKLESTEAAYRRGDEIEPKRRVMEAWGRYLTEGENQGIVVLTQRRA
jgi:integrase